jgi:hypothetical protein
VPTQPAPNAPAQPAPNAPAQPTQPAPNAPPSNAQTVAPSKFAYPIDVQYHGVLANSVFPSSSTVF